MKRKDLQHLKIDSTLFETQSDSTVTTTVEGIAIQKKYSKQTTKAIEDIDFAAGFAPFVRGISPLMHVQHPWQINQVPQSATLEKCNQVYRNQINQGQREITLISPAKSSRTNPQPTISSLEDMKVLLAQLPLDEITVSLYSSDTIIPLLACFIAAAQELGFEDSHITGHLHYDVLLPILTTNGAYSFEKATKVVTDTISYLHQHHPKFNSLSLSNKALKVFNLSAEEELAYSLTLGIDLLQKASKQQIPVNYIATHLSYAWILGSDHFVEIAKMRAARGIWSTLLRPFNLKDEQALALPIRTQTSDIDLQTTEPMDTLACATIEATAAVFGGTQALYLQLPPTASTTLTAGQMQRFLMEEIKSCKTIDPWAGSYYVEKLTLDLVEKTINLLPSLTERGGIQSVLAARIQAKANEHGPIPSIPLRKEVAGALAKLTHSVQTKGENVLASAIEAAKVGATLDAIHQALLH
ncbi:methylmalonyl-CoA mutase family protein [Myroides sp. DF42-4-2]|uniref:methylmalonyl-CoA mutase family protein n=1 Tax=unclassified Myroides TaxID=2642485 RepID=UPI0025768435|nr:methylmalonyl-CoA mutase family protein [Myroides sp. DF42-4-2]MDM1407767.1 methylmalonyl-CoA mutase [Myroides sp. DF42-4-2]